MKHKSFGSSECPVARSLERVGEWWSILILREAFYGAKKFDEFQKGLEGVAPNTLTRRLKDLVEAGVLERWIYSTRPERYEYILTECGRDFYPVLWTMIEWGNKHFSPDGDSIQIKNIKTKKKAVICLADKNTGKEISRAHYQVVPGPNASLALREKLALRLKTS